MCFVKKKWLRFKLLYTLISYYRYTLQYVREHTLVCSIHDHILLWKRWRCAHVFNRKKTSRKEGYRKLLEVKAYIKQHFLYQVIKCMHFTFKFVIFCWSSFRLEKVFYSISSPLRKIIECCKNLILQKAFFKKNNFVHKKI